MHPEFARELTDQRGREMRARARQAQLARIAIRVGRRRRHQPDETDGFVLPTIPDYVDGSFRTEPAGEAAGAEAGQAPAAHHAA
jgi:hypothetical protein